MTYKTSTSIRVAATFPNGRIDDAAIVSAVRTIGIERAALETLRTAIANTNLGRDVSSAVEIIARAPGKVIVTGMGKSGLVGRKIAATLASTGTPAFFLHPGEASHGDLGMIGSGDVVLALSWSGETAELADVVNYCARYDIKLIAMTSKISSTLARRAAVRLVLPDVQEACPNDLAPTSSTTMQGTIGDALAIAVMERRRFSPSDFHRLHPRGQLGAKLIRVGDIMTRDDALPCVAAGATIAAATLEMTAKRFGITAVVDADEGLIGVFSDGDLRRSLASGSMDDPVRDHMTSHPTIVAPAMLASEALAVMNARSISQLFVVDEGRLVGILHLHDLIRLGAA